MSEALSRAEIELRINLLSDIAAQRMKEASPEFASLMGGAPAAFLTRDEAEDLHQLQLQLPTFAELRLEAKERIRDRIIARRRGMNRTYLQTT